MADIVRLVEYFYITAPNKAGERARALTTLKDIKKAAGVLGASASTSAAAAT